MNVADIKKLETKTKEELLEIIIGLEEVSGVSKFIKLNYLMTSEELVKALTKIFIKYQRRTKQYDYSKTIIFFEELRHYVLLPIREILNKVPMAAATLLQSMVDGFPALVASKDTSSGCASQFLIECVELWGKAWQYVENKNIEKLAALVIDYYLHHDYIALEIFTCFKVALGKLGLLIVEKELSDKSDTLLFLIELQGDPDRYIKELERTNIHLIKYELKAAEMLINDLRADEALKRLKKIDNKYNGDQYIEVQELLIRAFSDEGLTKEAQQVRWQAFTHTLDPHYYKDFIKNTVPALKDEVRAQAIQFVLKNNNFNATLLFLEYIQEYDYIEKLILKNLNKLDQYSYSYYRKLSKTLALNGCLLSATLIRRSLVDDLLAKTLSKYYMYAVSDLKMSIEFGEQIKDWQGFNNNFEYLNILKIRHKKKYSFWDKINFI